MSGWCRTCHPHLLAPPDQPRSCRTCMAWGPFEGKYCKACRSFARAHSDGECAGCDRRLPVHDGYCRLCWHQARLLAHPLSKDGTAALPAVRITGQQLFLADTHRCITRFNPSRAERRAKAAGQQVVPEDRPAREGAWPMQPELFTLPAPLVPPKILDGDHLRRDWYAHLVSYLDRIGDRNGWTHHVRDSVALTLRAVVAAHPAGTPIYRASAVARLADGGHRNVARTLELLQILGRLDDDRPARADLWIDRRLASLTGGIRSEVADWVDVLRRGDARHRPKSELTWKNYLDQALPTLTAWAAVHDSLREITRDDVAVALKAPTPRDGDGHTRLTALRSLFAYLKANRRTFRNPTRRLSRNLTQHSEPHIPTRLPASAFSDLTTGERDAVKWLVLVLTAHHALSQTQMRTLALDDVDLPNRHLAIGDQSRPLDDLTVAALESYLRYRHARWPRTANPHLLLTQQTAHGDRPVSRWWLQNGVRGHQVTLDRLRQDRILDESTAAGAPDPLHVAAVFGLHPDTAQRYVDASFGTQLDRSPDLRTERDPGY